MDVFSKKSKIYKTLKNITIFLLGFFVAISIAATTTDLITFKPAKPISTIVYSGLDPDSFIIQNSRRGYIVDKLSVIPNYSSALVVMVKY